MADGDESHDQCLWTAGRQFGSDLLSAGYVPCFGYNLNRQAAAFNICQLDRFLLLRHLRFGDQRHDWTTNQAMDR